MTNRRFEPGFELPNHSTILAVRMSVNDILGGQDISAVCEIGGNLFGDRVMLQ